MPIKPGCCRAISRKSDSTPGYAAGNKDRKTMVAHEAWLCLSNSAVQFRCSADGAGYVVPIREEVFPKGVAPSPTSGWHPCDGRPKKLRSFMRKSTARSLRSICRAMGHYCRMSWEPTQRLAVTFPREMRDRPSTSIANIATLLQYLYISRSSPPSMFAKWYDLLRFAKARRSSPWPTDHRR
jgi:hypothetical protein